MSTSLLKTLPGKRDIKRHSPSILYLQVCFLDYTNSEMASVARSHVEGLIMVFCSTVGYLEFVEKSSVNIVAFWQLLGLLSYII